MKTSLLLQSAMALFFTNPASADSLPPQWFFDPTKQGQLFGYFDSSTNEPISI